VTTPPPFTTGNILPPAADAGGLQRGEPLAPGAAGANPNQNLTFQIVSANFRMRLQALESKSRVTQLATPLLLTANNEVSRIFIGSTVPIVVGYTQPVIAQNGLGGAVVAGAVPQIELRDIGQGLLITPNINADRTVTLRVAQEQSALGPQRTVTIPDGAGGVANGLVDVVNVTNVTGTVVAKDGLTVAIGGLIRENLTDTRAAVPVLGKMPVVGIMFRNQVTGKTRDELIVLIRPYVFNTPQENAALSHDLVSELSLHPHAPNAQGTMNSFAPQEILTANPPMHPLQTIFRLHHLEPKIY
jgi:general secretion pathway protein D